MLYPSEDIIFSTTFSPTTGRGMMADGSVGSGSIVIDFGYCLIVGCNLSGLLRNFPFHIYVRIKYVDVARV